mmetsp:Transcript_9162/g.27076  ORF Transcript_9162/g.27076 Transcript_9162/m.27076 type:complete len:363 (+) Transcript_9162:840-1928(+)
MRRLADTLHSRGQKLGLYLNPGLPKAAVRAASPVLDSPGCTAAAAAARPLRPANRFGNAFALNWSSPCAAAYVRSVAHQFSAELRADLLKLDAVSPGSEWHGDNARFVAALSRALEATGRTVWVSLSWSIDPASAAAFVPFANSWRTSDDVECYCDVLERWPAVRRRFAQARPWLRYSCEAGGSDRACDASRGRPDLDSLDVGNGALDGVSDEERKSAASLWALIGGPLVTGSDLTRLTPSGLALLTHGGFLAVHRAAGDRTAVPDEQSCAGGGECWRLRLPDGSDVWGLFNLRDETARVGFAAAAPFTARDLWSGAGLGPPAAGFNASLPAHGCILLQARPVAGGGAASWLYTPAPESTRQ